MIGSWFYPVPSLVVAIFYGLYLQAKPLLSKW